jgi:solute:Na+ symporter, SSS family
MLLTSVIIYLLITIVIGVATSKLVHSSDDYMSAGRKIPFLLSSAALFALWFGSETVFGASSEFVEHGLIGVIEDPFGGVLCLLLYAFVFVRPLYKMKLLTLGDLFRSHYGARIEFVSSIFMLITFFGYIAAQLVALGIILNLISGISLTYGIIISAFIVTLYTMAGGMWAISITDFVQSIIIVLGLVAVAWSVTVAGGGTENILHQAPENTFRFFPQARVSDWIQWFAAWMVLGLGSLPSQDIFQRMNAAKSEKVAVNSTIFGALVYLVIAMLPLYLGLAAKVLYASEIAGMDSQQVLPMMVLKHSNIYVQILFFGALLSAIFSTCSGAILAPASIVSENIIRPYLKKELNDKKFLLLLRLSVVVIAVIATLMALSRNNIYELVAESSILGLVTLLVPMFCAIYWKPANSFGALLSMLFGFTTWFIFEHVLELDFPALIAGFAASIIGIIAGSNYRKSLKDSYRRNA